MTQQKTLRNGADLVGRRIIGTGSDYVTLDNGQRLYLDPVELTSEEDARAMDADDLRVLAPKIAERVKV